MFRWASESCCRAGLAGGISFLRRNCDSQFRKKREGTTGYPLGEPAGFARSASPFMNKAPSVARTIPQPGELFKGLSPELFARTEIFAGGGWGDCALLRKL